MSSYGGDREPLVGDERTTSRNRRTSTMSNGADLAPPRDRRISTMSNSVDPTPSTSRTVPVSNGNNVDDDELILDGCAGSCFCHPQALCHRIIALILMCVLGFGSYFCFDNPGALQVRNKQAIDRDWKIFFTKIAD